MIRSIITKCLPLFFLTVAAVAGQALYDATQSAVPVAQAAGPLIEVRAGYVSHNSSGTKRVTFSTPFINTPKSVVIGRNWDQEDQELGEVNDLTNEGFTLSGDKIGNGNTAEGEYYIAVSGALSDVIQAGVYRDWNTKNYGYIPQPYYVPFPSGSFTSAPDTVIIARDYNAQSGIEIARVNNITKDGFSFSGSQATYSTCARGSYCTQYASWGAGSIYWIALKNDARVASFLKGGAFQQTGASTYSVPVDFGSTPQAVAVSRNYWGLDEQMGTIKSVNSSSFSYSGNASDWTGGRGTDKYCSQLQITSRSSVCVAYGGDQQNFLYWLAATNGSYSDFDPLAVKLEASKRSGEAPYTSELTATVTGGDPSKTINYSFYCDWNSDSTIVADGPTPSGKYDSIKDLTKSQACNYTNNGVTSTTKYAKVIVERGDEVRQARVNIAVDPESLVNLSVDPPRAAIPAQPELTASIRNVNSLPDSAKTVTATAKQQDAGYEIQSGRATGSSSTTVAFSQPFKNVPQSVVVTKHYTNGNKDNYYVNNISKTGFVFHDDDAKGDFSWLAVSGSIPGKLQAGVIQKSGSVYFSTPMEGNTDDVAVIITRGRGVNDAADDQMLHVAADTNGFSWGGDASGNYPHYWVAISKGINAPGETNPAIFGGKFYQNSSSQVNYSNYGFTFTRTDVNVQLARNFSAENQEMLYVKIPGTADLKNTSAYEATQYFQRLGDASDWKNSCILNLFVSNCDKQLLYDYWIAMDRPYLGDFDPLTVTLGADATDAYGSLDVKLTANATKGDLGQKVTYTFYCDQSSTSTAITDPNDKKYESVDADVNRAAACHYDNTTGQTITKHAKVIVQRGNETVQAQVPITIRPKVTYTYNFYCQSTDDSTTVVPGAQVVTTSDLSVKSKACSYKDAGAYVPKVIIQSNVLPTSMARTDFLATDGQVDGPTFTLEAVPGSVDGPGDPTTLYWTSANATKVIVAGAEVQANVAGSVVKNPQKTTTYTGLACDSLGICATGSVTVTVADAPGTPTFTLVADKTTVKPGGDVKLTWTSTNATSVKIDSNAVTPLSGGNVTKNPFTTTTYTGEACNSVGVCADSSVTVLVINKPPVNNPTLTLVANPSFLQKSGDTTKLVWTSTNATSVIITDTLTSQTVTPVAGGGITKKPLVTTSYVGKACNDQNICATATTTVTVSGSPQFYLHADKENLANPGDPVVLSWYSKNAASVIVDGASVTANTTGTATKNPTGTTTYTGKACDATGSLCATDKVTVTVGNVSAAPTFSLVPDKTSVNQGQSVKLTWTSTNATSVKISDGSNTQSVTPVAGGSIDKVPSAPSTTYTGTGCNDAGECSTSSVTISVVAPTYSGDDIDYGQGSNQW